METTNLKIKVILLTPMLGTVPKNKEIYTAFVASKNPDGIDNAEVETVEDIEEKGWTGFHSDENGLFIYEYMVKGMLKNAGNVLKDIQKIKALRSKIDNYVFIKPRRIYLDKKVPDGILERPLRAQTMQGPRVTLTRSDYVNAGTEFEFEVLLIPHKEVTEQLIMTLFEYGQLMGFGQFRNGGYGRFEIIK